MNVDTTERMLDAGEYVLGTLAGAERAQFEKQLTADASARAEVRYWEKRLTPLGAAIKPVTPRAIVWTQIAFAAGLHRAGGATRSLRVWQVMTSLATAASLLLGLALWQKSTEPPQVLVQVQKEIVPQPAPATYVSVLQVPGSDARWLVSLTPERKALHCRALGEYQPQAGKYLHLWWLNPDGPKSLGEMPKSGAMDSGLPAGLDLEKGNGLAISLEDKSKVPTLAPFGPVLVAAPVMKAI